MLSWSALACVLLAGLASHPVRGALAGLLRAALRSGDVQVHIFCPFGAEKPRAACSGPSPKRGNFVQAVPWTDDGTNDALSWVGVWKMDFPEYIKPCKVGTCSHWCRLWPWCCTFWI